MVGGTHSANFSLTPHSTHRMHDVDVIPHRQIRSHCTWILGLFGVGSGASGWSQVHQMAKCGEEIAKFSLLDGH